MNKSRIKKVIRVFLFLAAMAVVVSCGKKDDKQNNTAEITPTASPKETEVANEGLKDAFKDEFLIGSAVNSNNFSDKYMMEFITKQFNTVTMENEMKPDSLLDHDKSIKAADKLPEINTEKLGMILSNAKSNGLLVHGHTLVWHSQTPDWLFYEDYDSSKDYVNKKTMLKRMEAFIKKVLTFCKEEYPGVVYAYDVVNEAVADGESSLRKDSPWYQIIGEDYIEYAFKYARKYAEPEMKLILNDYNCYDTKKCLMLCSTAKKLKEKGYLDAVGMQTHISMDSPEIYMIEFAMEKFSEIEGMEIQLTEVDMHNTDNSEEGLRKQAERYKELFSMIMEMKRSSKANITSVTFWGLCDSMTWLTNFRKETSYPLLFDKNLQPKPAYFSVMEAAAQ